MFKLVGLGIGPLLALLGFVWGLVDKAELRFLTRELGKAEEKAAASERDAQAAKSEFDAKEKRIEALQKDLTVIADAGKLWQLRPNAPFPNYRGWKHDPRGAKVVTIGLFKGGIGKTHLAANFAAYVSERRQKPVLLIDLDYQGSLSSMIMPAAGLDPKGSAVDPLFSVDANLAVLSQARVHLARHGDATALNRGAGLSRAWLVPADYTLAEVESRLLVERVIDNRDALDERYRLAHLLLNPDVRRDYELIIFDTPPRMTLGTVNALVASHCFVMPVLLDRVSSEAVRPFVTQVELLKRDLDLDLRFAGAVATLTRESDRLAGREPEVWENVGTTLGDVYPNVDKPCVSQHVPRKAAITNSGDLGYFLSDDTGSLSERFYDAVFDELWDRIMEKPQESR